MIADLNQPLYQIRYGEQVDAVTLTPGDLDATWHYSKARQMKHAHLAELIFQLVDSGYSVARDVEDHDGFVVVFAWSREYVRRVGQW